MTRDHLPKRIYKVRRKDCIFILHWAGYLKRLMSTWLKVDGQDPLSRRSSPRQWRCCCKHVFVFLILTTGQSLRPACSLHGPPFSCLSPLSLHCWIKTLSREIGALISFDLFYCAGERNCALQDKIHLPLRWCPARALPSLCCDDVIVFICNHQGRRQVCSGSEKGSSRNAFTCSSMYAPDFWHI